MHTNNRITQTHFKPSIKIFYLKYYKTHNNTLNEHMRRVKSSPHSLRSAFATHRSSDLNHTRTGTLRHLKHTQTTVSSQMKTSVIKVKTQQTAKDEQNRLQFTEQTPEHDGTEERNIALGGCRIKSSDCHTIGRV